MARTRKEEVRSAGFQVEEDDAEALEGQEPTILH